MVFARIDHDEPFYAEKAAEDLAHHGYVPHIEPALQEEIDTEWTYGDYPMHWLAREEVREVSAEAQRIHDDIAAGRLAVHVHAHDGWTTVAVGTYQGGKSVHLHGENYLRQETTDYESEAEAVADFHRQYTVAVRPGPAPLTSIERAAAAILCGSPVLATTQTSASSEPLLETVPVYAAAPGDHEALLNDFLNTHGEWEKYRPHDETTIASHESLALRVEFLHEAVHGDNAWAIAAYESPVGERLWHATVSPTTPVEIAEALLNSLASGNGWGPEPAKAVTNETLAEATRPLAETGWPQTVTARLIEWRAPGAEPAAVSFDTLAATKPNGLIDTWTVWGGNTPHQPNWFVRLSTHTPAALLQDIAFELAYGQGHRQRPTSTARLASRMLTQPPIGRPSQRASRTAGIR
ncbi:DUF317 domain-containing protein [Streptomyces sp. NBC_00160]|uniref:DUF317 domain-containing protein n=1 Tax=Streptomyces sp. NBC_00160 TaxID=2903628 RepID=UPI002259A6F2|nr:DUF317 domain-containing protein [Streptomyces sp. NBC_00160]MCX5303171.1 DUF317 domain-containing protein [Streptomyces sp. NBC_00160]